MISDQILGSIIGGIGGAAGAILVALAFVLRYLNARDMRNKESFEHLAGVYAAMLKDIIQSHERTLERVLNSVE